MKITKAAVLMLAVVLCTLATGCSVMDNIVDEASKEARKDKVVCKLNSENATQISYKGTTYQILNVPLERSKIGGWIGVIRQMAVLDNNNCILQQKEMNSSVSLMMKNLKDDLPEDAKYIVSFENVFLVKDTENKKTIAVNINSKFYKSVPAGTESADETAIKFESEDCSSDLFELNKNDCSQLLCGNQVYQITSQKVDNEDLDKVLSALTKKITVDESTKETIANKDLLKIELIPGDLSKQKRIYLNFGEIYSIKSLDYHKVVAVNINNQYRCAEIIK